MNYHKLYAQIIYDPRNNVRTGYIEKHHIIPRSLGGTNVSENIVRLTACQHFVCHWLLTKMYEGKAKAKMIHAFYLMSTHKNRRLNSFSYSKIKKEYGKIIGDRNRKGLSEYHRKRISESGTGIKKPGTSSAMRGKKHSLGFKHPNEFGEAIAKRQMGKKRGPNKKQWSQEARLACSKRFSIPCPVSREVLEKDANELRSDEMTEKYHVCYPLLLKWMRAFSPSIQKKIIRVKPKPKPYKERNSQ